MCFHVFPPLEFLTLLLLVSYPSATVRLDLLWTPDSVVIFFYDLFRWQIIANGWCLQCLLLQLHLLSLPLTETDIDKMVRSDLLGIHHTPTHTFYWILKLSHVLTIWAETFCGESWCIIDSSWIFKPTSMGIALYRSGYTPQIS